MTKLCPRGKAAAKRKFKVYPSAYANAYASKICAGKAKDPSGLRRKDFKGPKPAGKKEGGMTAGSRSALGRLQKSRMQQRRKNKIKDPNAGVTYDRPRGQINRKPVLISAASGGYIGSHIKSDLAGEPVSNKSYEAYYKDLL